MLIKVNTVEGKTNKKGSKQGRIYQIIQENQTPNFFTAITETGKKMTIWNIKKDWSRIGINTQNSNRFTYTSDFTIL